MLGQTEDDVEGNWVRIKLRPTGTEDAEGQAWRAKVLEPVETEDAEGNALRTHVLEIERDENGELVGGYLPAEKDEDTQGSGYRAGV